MDSERSEEERRTCSIGWAAVIGTTPTRLNANGAVVSRDHRNSARKRFSRSLPTERLSRATVQLGGNAVELRVAVKY